MLAITSLRMSLNTRARRSPSHWKRELWAEWHLPCNITAFILKFREDMLALIREGGSHLWRVNLKEIHSFKNTAQTSNCCVLWRAAIMAWASKRLIFLTAAVNLCDSKGTHSNSPVNRKSCECSEPNRGKAAQLTWLHSSLLLSFWFSSPF